MMALSEAANIVQGKLYGADALFTTVATDSRAIERGDLFVAIPGDKFDGHDFVTQAKKKGAVGAMVSAAVNTDSAQIDMPQIKVPDTTQALGQLASHWRLRFDIPVLAITGSNGKTTVTAMAASILNQCGNCLFPERSFNNQWGVPLTLLKLNEHHDFAVIEMGTNHIGEIATLSRLTQPTIALINNVAPAHLKGLGNLQQIAQAKAEIFSGLKENGTAVINADDQFSDQWLSQVKPQLKTGRVITFAMEKPADLSITNLRLGSYKSLDRAPSHRTQTESKPRKTRGSIGKILSAATSEWLTSRFDLHIVDEPHNEQHIAINLALPGRHNVMNALAAAAICHAAGATIQSIKTGLENMQAVNGRLNPRPGLMGCIVIDDSYNANPQSIKVGIDVLENFGGARILVLGAMAELGKISKQQHHEVGRYAHKKRIDILMCLVSQDNGGNNDAGEYARGFGKGAQVFQSLDDLVAELKGNLSVGVAVLVKGSRSSMMERVVAEIIEAEDFEDGQDYRHDHGQNHGQLNHRGEAKPC